MTGTTLALSYIITGGLVFTVNILLALLLMNKLSRPVQTLTIYKASDATVSALSGLALVCDGCLYLNSQNYCSSCSRLFMIHILLIFPSIVSHFSAYGVCIKYIQDTTERFTETHTLRNTVTWIWTAIAWITALVFTILSWSGRQQGFTGHVTQDNSSPVMLNETSKSSRSIVDNLWQYNSNEDWSSDYRESVIIGLIYGIVQGNISHDELQKIHGVSLNGGLTNQTKDRIQGFHAALGIPEEVSSKIFSYSNNNLNNGNFTTGNKKIHYNDKIHSTPFIKNHENYTLKSGNPFHNLYNQVYSKASTVNPLVSLLRDDSDSQENVTNTDVLDESVISNTSESESEQNNDLSPQHNQSQPSKVTTTATLCHNTCRNDMVDGTCKAQPILWTVIMVVVVVVAPVLAGAKLVLTVPLNQHFQQLSVAEPPQPHTALSMKHRCKVVVLLVTTVVCWTPVITERVVSAWLELGQPHCQPVSLNLLFLLLIGHLQGLLRAVFYISHHRSEEARISVLPDSESPPTRLSYPPPNTSVAFTVSS